ncbi:MAG: SIS domain-containing protein [Planctomycetaceae bacterium]
MASRLLRAAETIRAWGTAGSDGDHALESVVTDCERAAAELGGIPGLQAMLEDGGALASATSRLGEALGRFETLLDQRASSLGTGRVERLNSLLIRAKDAQFALERDRLGNQEKVRALAGGSRAVGHAQAAYDINLALNSLDRLEVRGRDSAGIHLFVRGAFDSILAESAEELAAREAIPNFTHRAVRRIAGAPGGSVLSFVYKVAAEVGQLGDNVRVLRSAIVGDGLLHRVLETPGVTTEVLGHTRWASVGVISEENAHPLNQEPSENGTPYLVGVLNGDVDNYQELIRQENLTIPPAITTDAKVIPALVAKTARLEAQLADAYRRVVARFDGSVAVAAACAQQPGHLNLSLRGSGQALYVGLAEDRFLVASEPYGIVEETPFYLRLDGEAPAAADKPSSRGQVVVLDAESAGKPEGILRVAFDGTPLPLRTKDLKRLEITTRDVDRGAHSHFLKKEISEAPLSVRKTLRGRLVEEHGLTRVSLGEESFPAAIREKLKAGEFHRILVIGQGTAAVAGQAVAEAFRDALGSSPIAVQALPATELSGFHLRDEMGDILVVAISQSGTTTDTNRTVDLVRSRGAPVIGIVNRRNSDLTDRVDGVLYTSDGRDVEMSVASTKAFYSQVAAGILLGEAIAEVCGVGDPQARSALLRALTALPDSMRKVLENEDAIARAADRTAPQRRHWAIVGNGRNRIAAQEIRIKLSELCYKSIACDSTEDKKHIDLSSEPLILVCATGLDGSNASDVAKEIEIYAAHKACPVVIATEGEDRFRAAEATLFVPEVDPALAFILTTVTGHLFGYHAAQAIDRLALPLRQARAAIEVGERAAGPGRDLRDQLRPQLDGPFRSFSETLRSGRYDGVMEAATATRLSLLLRYATAALPLEYFQEDFGRVGTPGVAVEELTLALTRGIEELSRPVDAIKHQAKTVTVGTSRGDDALLAVPLVQAILAAGTPRELLAYRDLRALQALDPAVSGVRGFTRYAIDAMPEGSRIRVVGQGGTSAGLRSRTTSNPELRGTKNTVALERQVLVAVGRSDGRPIILVPESRRGVCTGIVLLHADFRDRLAPDIVRSVLSGYRNRFALIRDALAETGADASEDAVARALAQRPILDGLTQPVLVLADALGATTYSP